ncbi:MAG: hypothetical protein IT255_05185, partial [Chitinophagaceae bacterium]|nr:hypothetical protein [Chitinophagaceae bacterium]
MYQRIYVSANQKKLLLLSIIILGILYSCKKFDITLPGTPDIKLQEDFFKTKEPVSKEALGVIQLLKQQNERNAFVTQLPRNCGLPVWSKLIFPKISITQSLSFFGDSSENTNNIIVPLTASGNNISTIITGKKINDSTYQLYWFTVDDLYNLCHAPNKNIKQAESLLGLFLSMESATFGRTDFYHIPKD